MSQSDDGEAFRAYWSIYTDFRGRQQFREFYWDRLKDIVGRPARLGRIERERWEGNHTELHCHVSAEFRAMSRQAALADILRRACAIAQPWQVFLHDLSDEAANDDVFEIIWYRGWDRDADRAMPFPLLPTILVSVMRDNRRPATGRRRGRTASVPLVGRPDGGRNRAFHAIWSMEVQTSTKRSLMETHWPVIQRQFPEGCAKIVDLEKRSGDIGPFKFQMRQTLAGISENEAIAVCLRMASGMRIWATWDAVNHLSQLKGVARQGGTDAWRISDFVLLPAADETPQD